MRAIVPLSSVQIDPLSTLPLLIAASLRRNADSTACVFEDLSISYRELDAASARLATHLRAMGVGPETVVGIAMERSLELMIGLIAIWRAGGAYLPLDPDYPAERLDYMLDDSSAPIVLTHSKLSTPLDLCRATAIEVDTLLATELRTPDDVDYTWVQTEPDQLAYVLYTSGSTGRPKGVMIEHCSIANRISWMQDAFPVGRGDAILQKTPTSFDVSVWELFWPLCVGAVQVLAKPGGHRDDAYLVDLIVDSGITTLHFVPSMLAAFLENPSVSRCDGVLKRVICSGEALPIGLARRFAERLGGVELHNLYGPTEAAVDVSHWRADPEDDDVPIGRAISGVVLYVVDPETGQRVTPGTEGELWISGVQVGRGYLGKPELTAERFIDDPFNAGQRVYRTGDLVRQRPGGEIVFLGRIDHQVKIRGFRIELGEIEATFLEHDTVREATVVARDDVTASPTLVAYATVKAPPEKSAAEVAVWGGVFDAAYTQRRNDGEADFAGWNSSYTGGPIPKDEMHVWRDGTLKRLRALKPRRVLELGCGTGMLLFGLVDSVEHYTGTDLSADAIARLEDVRKERGWSHVELRASAAHEIADYDDGSFDLVIVNSVLQFFPGPNYLRNIIDEGRRVVGDNGNLFFGDVRSLPHLEAFHRSVETYKSGSDTPKDILNTRIQEAVAQEDELLVDPDFFRCSGAGFGEVNVLWRRGRNENEMTRFRYDAILKVNNCANIDEPTSTSWPGIAGLSDLSEDRYVFRDVVNARIEDTGLDPEDIADRASALGYAPRFEPSETAPECMTVYLDRKGVSPWVPPARPRLEAMQEMALVNNPGLGQSARDLKREWRNILGQRLPDHMIPYEVVVLPVMPLTPSGKVDRKQLPAPVLLRREGAVVAAQNETEARLVDVWKQVLGVPVIGIHDSFFDLGGDSITALKIVSAARENGLALTPALLFAAHTVAEIARALDDTTQIAVISEPSRGALILTPMQHWVIAHAPVAPNRTGSVTRLRLIKPVQIDQLRLAVAAVAHHHDAFRLGVSGDGPAWVAEFGDDFGLDVTQDREQMFTPFDLTDGSVGRILLEDDHLTLYLSHLVADGVSAALVAEDLDRALTALDEGRQIILPPVISSFHHAAERLHDYATAEALKQTDYWLGVLGAQSASLPLDPRGSNLESDTKSVQRVLDPELTKMILRAAPKHKSVGVDDILLSSLAVALGELTGAQSFVVDTESHGRVPALADIDLSRTCGVFSSLYPVHLTLADTVHTSLRRIARDRRRIPDSGIGFGLHRWQIPNSALADYPARDVLFNYMGKLGQVGQHFEHCADADTGFRAPHEQRSHPLIVEAMVVDDALHLRWSYSSTQMSADSIAKAADAQVEALRRLAAPASEAEIRFPHCPFDPAELEPGIDLNKVEDIYPLGPLQEGMLLHSLLNPDSGIYKIQVGGHVGDQLDEKAFRKAWLELARLHPVLRTRFLVDQAPEPVQVVFRTAAPIFIVSDWRGLDQDQQIAARRQARATYDLDQPGLASLEVARVDDGLLIFLDFHHVLLDGWSMLDLVEDLMTLARRRSKVGTDRPGYREYVNWARGRRERGDGFDVFRERLAGVPEPVRLPFDGGEPFEGPDAHTKLVREFPLDGLKTIARRARVTQNVVLQAVWALTLAHTSGAKDVVFGVVVPGRPAEIRDADRIVGLLMNTLPMRVTVDDGSHIDVDDWLRAQQDQMTEILEFQHLPLSDVQKLVGLKSKTPLLSSVISVQGYLRGAASLGDWAAGTGIDNLIFEDWNEFPFSVAVEIGDQLSVTLKYDRTLASENMARAMLRDFQTVIETLNFANSVGKVLECLEQETRQRRMQRSKEMTGAKIRRRVERI